MAAYHLVLFSLRPQNRSTLWFGLLCATIATRVSIYSDYALIDQFTPGLPFQWQHKFEFLTFTLGTIFTLAFIKELYPKELSSRWVLKPAIFVSSLYSVLIILSTLKIFSSYLLYYQVIFLAIALASLCAVGVAAKKNETEPLFSCPASVFFSSNSSATLTCNERIKLVNVLHFAQVIFFLQTYYPFASQMHSSRSKKLKKKLKSSIKA